MQVAPPVRRLVRFVLVAVLLVPASALAWVETTVRSHHARVTVEQDGRAIVRHELVLKLRGGPLESIDVLGVGSGIEPLPDAVVRRAETGSASRWPLVQKPSEAGDLRLDIVAEQGLRGGSFVFEFGYAISLVERGWLRAKNDGTTEVVFVGPRLASGVDAARVTFLVPSTTHPPELVRATEGSSAHVLLHQVRRAASHDEIELVRAHLAVGEPALWQVSVDSKAFTLAAEAERAVALEPVPVVERALARRGLGGLEFAAILGAGLAFGALVAKKGRDVERAAARAGARARPLLPGSPRVRGLLAGLAVAGTVTLALTQKPMLAALVASLALLLSTFLLPSRLRVARGPGTWQKLAAPLERKIGRSAEPLAGRLFELGTVRGCLFFLALALGVLGVAYRLLAVSNYLALMSGLFLVLVLPLFWTGRRRDLPEDPEVQGERWFRYLQKKLDARAVELELWGRRPTAGISDALGPLDPLVAAPDEVRVRLVPRRSVTGLRALEVVLEEGAGSFVMPCVLVRVLEDSEAHRRLPADLGWVRGRTNEEKVTVVRPITPTPVELARSVRSLLQALGRAPEKPSSDKTSPKSSGSGQVTSNGESSVPAHAI